MSNVQIYNSTPNILYTGIDDKSGRVITPEVEQLPQHLPLFFGFFEKGNEEVNVVGSSSLKTTYGSKFLDYSGKYATHSTPFIEGITGEGNLVMVQRLRPEGAKTAWIRLSLGVLKRPLVDRRLATAKEIAENAEGLDPTKTYIIKPRAVEGYSLRWIIGTPSEKAIEEKVAEMDMDERNRFRNHFQFGKGMTVAELGPLHDVEVSSVAQGIAVTYGNSPELGSRVYDSQQERVYPILDLEVTDFGAYGNNVGLRLSCPNRTDVSPPDMRFFENQLVRAYRATIVTRKDRRSSSVAVKNILGEEAVDFVLRKHTLNRVSGDDMYVGTKFLDAYRDLDITGGKLPVYGPFNQIKVYDENIKHITEVLYKLERETERDINSPGYIRDVAQREMLVDGQRISVDYSTQGLKEGRRILDLAKDVDPEDEDAIEAAQWQIDIFTAKDINGFSYRTFQVSDQLNFDSVNDARGIARPQLTSTTEHYCQGGSDGNMSIREYHRLVAQKLDEMADEYSYWNDLARYPFSVFYDTGFPNYVKEKIVELIRIRKDVSISLATHAFPDDEDEFAKSGNIIDGVIPLSREEEVGAVRNLYAIATRYPESDVFGTRSCRANIMMQCGNIIGSNYKGKVPMTYELAMKRARYMGAANGKYRPGYGYDQDGMKQLQYVKHLNNTFVPYAVREKNWAHGATWAQYYDRRTMFFPAVRTVYRDETSVLVSDINMLIATDLEKVCYRVWRRLVGITTLSNAQLVERSNGMINSETLGAYDGRVTIVPNTYFTPGDEQRGYSWRCEIHMYANNMKTVGVFTVVTHRQEELEGGR